jgi:hypothetical protein
MQQKLILTLEDDVFWRLYEQAAREHLKAHEYAEALLARALEDADPKPVVAA